MGTCFPGPMDNSSDLITVLLPLKVPNDNIMEAAVHLSLGHVDIQNDTLDIFLSAWIKTSQKWIKLWV